MRPAQKAPENPEPDRRHLGPAQRASMRPAQKAPENPQETQARGSRATRFNEAGAKSAGKQVSIMSANDCSMPLQ